MSRMCHIYYLQLSFFSLILWWIFLIKGYKLLNDNLSEYNLTDSLEMNTTQIFNESIMLNDEFFDNATIIPNVTLDDENFTVSYNGSPQLNESFLSNFTFEENATGFSSESSTIVSKIDEIRKKSLPSCNCDLTAFSCDINCCCDDDCSEIDKNSFINCISPEPNKIDEKYCVSKEIVYVDNIKSEKLIERNGLLCVVQDNFKERYTYLDQPIIESIENYKKLVPHQSYSWVSDIYEEDKFEITFKAGKPVYIVQKKESKVIQWWLPARSFNGDCRARKISKYMIDEKISCQQIVNHQTCLKNQWLNARTFYKEFYFYIPSTSNNININITNANVSLLQVEPILDICYINACIPIIPKENYICRDSNKIPQNCSLVNEDVPSPVLDGNLCSNVVTLVEYIIVHDGINGIQKVTVNFETEKLPMGPFVQEFVINYLWKSDEIIFKRSGNPGYLPGQPILAGNIMKTSTSKSVILLNSDRNNWLTVMGKHLNGYCSRRNNDRISVKFGENLSTGCLFRINYNNKNIMDCRYMQELLMELLDGFNPPDYVGIFGNSDIHNIGDWVKIYKEGEPTPNSDTSTDNACSNVVLGLDIKIAYANVGSLNNPQPKIIGIIYQYAMPQYVQFPCFGPTCNSAVSHLVELKTSVSFIDVSKPVHPMYAEIPIMKISFPHDFFYPFLSGYSGSNVNSVSLNVVLNGLISFIILSKIQTCL